MAESAHNGNGCGLSCVINGGLQKEKEGKMVGYNMYYDETEKRISVREFNVGHCTMRDTRGADFTHANESNLFDSNNGFNFIKEEVEKKAVEINRYIARGDWLLRKCKDCGDYFIITGDEVWWFDNKGMSLPKRCGDCRKKKKVKKEEME